MWLFFDVPNMFVVSELVNVLCKFCFCLNVKPFWLSLPYTVFCADLKNKMTLP